MGGHAITSIVEHVTTRRAQQSLVRHELPPTPPDPPETPEGPRARAVAAAAALADGTFRVGPKHTWHAIRAKPVRYVFLLGGIGAAGAGCMAAGVSPEPYTIGFSVLVCGWATCKALPEIRACEGPNRLRSIGANVLWPAALCVATAAGGHPLGLDQVASPSAADILKAGGQSIVIGADVPTIVQTVLDVPEGGRAKRRFRRWLFGHGPQKAPDVNDSR